MDEKFNIYLEELNSYDNRKISTGEVFNSLTRFIYINYGKDLALELRKSYKGNDQLIKHFERYNLLKKAPGFCGCNGGYWILGG